MNLTLSCLVALVLAGSLAPTVQADEAAAAAKLAKIPTQAAESLKKLAGSGKIERLSIEKDGKRTVYEAEIVEAGHPDREVSVLPDGKLNAQEETTPLAQVPAPARQAIEAGAKGATIERVQHITRANGAETFEALYVLKGKKSEVEYLPDGKLKPEEK